MQIGFILNSQSFLGSQHCQPNCGSLNLSSSTFQNHVLGVELCSKKICWSSKGRYLNVMLVGNSIYGCNQGLTGSVWTLNPMTSVYERERFRYGNAHGRVCEDRCKLEWCNYNQRNALASNDQKVGERLGTVYPSELLEGSNPADILMSDFWTMRFLNS